MKVAIIHDWLVTYAGAERVLEQILKVYPDAKLYSMVDFIDGDERSFIQNKKVTTSFIQNLPFAKKKYRNYLPLMPFAVEQFDLSSYDLVISSSHAVAKAVITGPDQLHISYVHSPIRYAWDLQHQYLKESNLDKGIKGWIAKYLLHRIRKWDVGTANRVDVFVANSNFIKRRIEKVYRRDSVVIFPPVAVHDFPLNTKKSDYYLTASRMVPYKKINLIVDAFIRMPEKQLKVIGTGPDFDKIKQAASGFENIEILGYEPHSTLVKYMQKAKAFVFAAEEDFGIMPLEAQACGTPIIAYGKAGALDTVVDCKTGIFFKKQTVGCLIEAVNSFEKLSFEPSDIRAHALLFSNNNFTQHFSSFVEDELKKFKEKIK